MSNNNIEQEASELYDGQQLFNYHRQRRGALNLVGNLANGLFRVLDSQYAQNMEENPSQGIAQHTFTQESDVDLR